jgi:DNA-binding MarR family transcriptional regulator
MKNEKNSNKTACNHANPDTPVAHQLVHLFWQLAPAFTRWAESHMNERDLTPQRVYLMLPLKEHGSMTMSALRNILGVSATNITALVDALERENMVTRQPHATDRRATLIELTQKAHTILEENCANFKNQVSGIFDDFSAEQQQQFKSLLEHMRSALVQKNILKD